MHDLFTQALGIYAPWFVKDVEFNNKQLNSYIDFKRGTQFVDGSDDTKAYSTYDTEMKKYRHMNFLNLNAISMLGFLELSETMAKYG